MTSTNQEQSSKVPPTGGLTFIEQLHALSVELCPNPKVPLLIGTKDKKAYLLRGACKLWSCSVCGASNGRKWLARILNHMNKNKGTGRWYFLTITAHEKWHTPQRSIKNLRQGWKKLYNRMRRKYGVSEYVKVWEFHKDGSFHLHVLIRRKIGKKWLKDNSRECGMGYMCDSSASKNPGQVAGYCAKYLIKSFEHADKYEKGMRRIEASRDWEKLPELASDMETWEVTHSREYQKKRGMFYRNLGYSIVDRYPTENELEMAYYEDKIRWTEK